MHDQTLNDDKTIAEGKALIEENQVQSSFVEAPLTSETKLFEMEKQLAEMKDNWLRALAEGENLRRRAQRDKEDALKYGAVNFGREMVSIADNLQRALESCPVTDDMMPNIKSLISGVEMTAKEMLNVFQKHGIKKISPLGEKFDPNYHQAMFEVEHTEYPAGHVAQVLQDGYIMHDRLLRAAMVGVVKASLTPKEETLKADASVEKAS
ncbi:MAG: nucleotide exchange factor GrpE [Alphaproteobacteria bacterium]|nr:nucleotide exchange factor GrpE [Alphaproteobacteria bacterium]